ncbi:MAG: hypothetical protein GC155_07225, partial [Alphaproteobacteria bacterium]|nr:hypothetical protein [Alphaproteobacteria bacterium]
YEMVKGFAPMIREVIRTDRMPPYNADPHIGKFSGDMNLSNRDAQTLVHWIEAGAARGDSAIDPLKANAKPAPEWELGTPDLVLEIPAFKVPASGVVDYQNPIVTSPLTEPRWIRAVTVKPGDRQAVHHVVGPFSTYAVGGETLRYADGAGMLIQPGQRLRFQMHYTPYGKETTDVTRVGLYFYPKDKPPTTVRRKLVVANTNIELPPGEAHHKEVAYVTFPHEATLFSIFVHAHYRGENAHVYLQKPGGKEEMILSVPQYDFNWQRTYDLATPINLPAGSKVITRYEFDNSPNNPANPDPSKTITWGEQSWEEMEYTELSITFKGETAVDQKPEYMADTEKTRVLGILDSDIDGTVDKAELRGPMAPKILAQWDKLDVNGDGKLDPAELGPLTTLLAGGGREAQQAPAEGTEKQQ